MPWSIFSNEMPGLSARCLGANSLRFRLQVASPLKQPLRRGPTNILGV